MNIVLTSNETIDEVTVTFSSDNKITLPKLYRLTLMGPTETISFFIKGDKENGIVYHSDYKHNQKKVTYMTKERGLTAALRLWKEKVANGFSVDPPVTSTKRKCKRELPYIVVPYTNYNNKDIKFPCISTDILQGIWITAQICQNRLWFCDDNGNEIKMRGILRKTADYLQAILDADPEYVLILDCYRSDDKKILRIYDICHPDKNENINARVNILRRMLKAAKPKKNKSVITSRYALCSSLSELQQTSLLMNIMDGYRF